MSDDDKGSAAMLGSAMRHDGMDVVKPSAYLAMASGYDFGVFMTQHEAGEWLSRKDTIWKKIAPLYVWFEWEQMREARERLAVKEGHKFHAEILALHQEVERLRLTELEQNAIQWILNLRLSVGPDRQAALRGLLDKHKVTTERQRSAAPGH